MLLKSQNKLFSSRKRSGTNGSAGSLWRLPVSFAGIVAICYGIFGFVLQSNSKTQETISSSLQDISYIIYRTLESPLVFFGDIQDSLTQFNIERNETHKLSALKRRLQILTVENATLSNRIQDLEATLSYQNTSADDLQTFSCFGQGNSLATGYLFVHGGTHQNLSKNKVVLGKGALIGLIERVGNRFSKIILTSHEKCRIPVTGGTSQTEAILCGRGHGKHRLTFIQSDQTSGKGYEIGEPILTSGTDGIIPRGLLIGHVSSVSDTSITVKPAIDADTLKFIQVPTVERQSETHTFIQPESQLSESKP